MDTFETLGKILKPAAVLTSMGLTPERTLEIVNNHNLTFTTKYMSLTETFREQLKTIAKSVDVNINAMLNMLTTDQINDVLDKHKHFQWHYPNGEGYMELRGITKDEIGFWLDFEEDPFCETVSYRLHDLEIQDVLSLLATVENCLTLTSNVLLNS